MPLRLESSLRQLEDAAVGLGRDARELLLGCRRRPCRSSNASAAIRDATSPAWAPPIPSATAYTGARAK